MKVAHPVMKMAVGAAVGAMALAACSSNSATTNIATGPAGAFGSAPAASGTPHAGTLTFALSPGAVPNWLMPIVASGYNSVYNVFSFQDELWRPLYWFVNGVAPKEYPQLSLATDPKVSNGNTTFTFTMKPNYKWSDGTPVTSKDVQFFFDEVVAALKEGPANWAYYTPKLGVPDQIASVTTPNASTVVVTTKTAVNPTWFVEDQLGSLIPIPAHAWAKASVNGPILDFTNPANAKKIYDFLIAQNKLLKSYATNPLWKVVDGPYSLTSFTSTTGAYTMVPNTKYGGPHITPQSTIQGVPFTSDAAEFNAVKSGSIDQGYVPLTDVPQVKSIKSSYNVFGYPDFGWTYITYNFGDKTGSFNKIIGQLYIRQALAHLEDQAGYVKAFFFGAGGQAYGPVPSIPASPYTPSNAMTNPYAFSVTAATNLLKQHGWNVVPNGTDTCAKPGTGAGQCGAGIPAGAKLAWNLIYNTSPAIIGQQVTDLVSKAKQAGIQISLSSSNFNFMIANYNDPSPAGLKNINKWAMEDFGGFTDSTYPTTFGVFNTGGSSNVGFYSDPHADALIKASLSSPNANAVVNEAQYLTTNQPSLFQPNPDLVIVWKKTMSGDPRSFESITQYQLNPEFWYLKK